MSFFSLNWFKSKKEKQLEDLKVKEQEIKNALLSKQLEEKSAVTEKPYAKMKMVNNVLTVVFKDGSVLSKPNATIDDFTSVKNAKTETDVINAISTKEAVEERRRHEAEVKKIKAIKEGTSVLQRLSDFDVQEDVVYFKGTNRSIPQLLLEKFLEVISRVKNDSDDESLDEALNKDDEYLALKRFFMWCCLNPRAEVADELYRFLKENSFRITKQGFFVALRNVVTVRTDNEIVQFVSNAYNKVKAVWKKKPVDFYVHRNEDTGEYYINKNQYTENNDLGNLEELYNKLPEMEENRFTDDWTKTFDIRVGRLVNMPMEECNWSTQDCAAAGLHFTSDQIHYVGCGDTSVLILINPMKVVGIGQYKGRCYEYLPIMTVPREEATSILHDLDFDTLELDESYAVHELENLAERAKEGFSVEAKKHDFKIPEISTSQINSIVKNLDEMKYEISKRVVHL